MIRIDKSGVGIPEVLLTKGVAARRKLEDEFDAGELNFDFDRAIYGHKQVKARLIQVQSYKCCFCESKIGHVSPGDVEHFRPKGGWIQNNETINMPGYYWLTYEWENLFLSCQICNETYKRNFFPLTNPGNRALSHHYNIENETAVLIHPSDENPEEFITFEEEIPVTTEKNAKGTYTIYRTGIGRELLNERRLKVLNDVKKIYYYVKNIPTSASKLKSEGIEIVKEYYNDSQLDSTEYASMLRCFFKTNPINYL